MKSKYELLIIDDSIGMLRLLNNVLSKDYRVVTKRSCLDAFRWLEEGNYPALLIIDLGLCDNDGFQILKNLKISGLYRDIPLVLLSSYDQPDEVLSAQIKRADAYFQKPFNPTQLQETITQLLNTKYAYAAA